ncbi:OmpA/MotB family protein [Microvirga yunnanensis]|uniref:OmpA/MotB family protein n=1 Tax=Microvirga yunnanensis TaxID=2953740 RepID=UPI0021C63474|nr:OmpA family protein [Microvirga sp. HBU65207]
MASANVETLEEGDEGYFASVSDLMVGILFVFLLMLTVFALNFRDAEDEQKVARDRYEQAVRRAETAENERKLQTERAERERRAAELAREEARLAEDKARVAEDRARREAEIAAQQRAENERLRRLLEQAVAQLERDLEARQAARNRLLASLEEALRDRNVRVTLDTRSGILRIAGDLLFETGKWDLKDEARQTVAILANVLGRILPCYAQETAHEGCDPSTAPILEAVLVEGHTDRQPYRNLPADQSQERNDRLSTDRALTVFKELRQFQPTLEALRNNDQLPLLAFSGYGERRPLADAQGTTEADYLKNRRIDLRFVLSSRTSEEIERLREQIQQMLGQR